MTLYLLGERKLKIYTSDFKWLENLELLVPQANFNCFQLENRPLLWNNTLKERQKLFLSIDLRRPTAKFNFNATDSFIAGVSIIMTIVAAHIIIHNAYTIIVASANLSTNPIKWKTF